VRRRELEKGFRVQGLPEARRLASLVVNGGLDEPAWDDRLLVHLLREPVLDLLERLEGLSSSAGITRTSAEKIARIVRALRLYTRAEQAALIEVDVNETLDNTLAILQNRIKHVAEVRTAYGAGLPPARCGPEISQVWTNLLNNACDAIEEAGPDRPARVDIATACVDGRIRVTVANTGKPIPEGIRDRIFDPFFTTKPAGKGTGLGLSICAGILRDCGGTLRTWNEPDGVVFEATLVVAGPTPSADLPPAAVVAGGAVEPALARE
jgi:signal transduction histidine kinase